MSPIFRNRWLEVAFYGIMKNLFAKGHEVILLCDRYFQNEVEDNY